MKSWKFVYSPSYFSFYKGGLARFLKLLDLWIKFYRFPTVLSIDACVTIVAVDDLRILVQADFCFRFIDLLVLLILVSGRFRVIV